MMNDSILKLFNYVLPNFYHNLCRLIAITLLLFFIIFVLSKSNMIHMAGSSIKNFGLMIAIAIPLFIICYPLWKKISKKLKSSGLSIINIFEMILLSYVIYKILTKFITF